MPARTANVKKKRASTGTHANVQKLFDAAKNHGKEFGEPDQEVGDLQDALAIAYAIMKPAQRILFMTRCRAEVSAFEGV